MRNLQDGIRAFRSLECFVNCVCYNFQTNVRTFGRARLTLVESCSPPEAHVAVLVPPPPSSLGCRKPPIVCIRRDLSYIYLHLSSWRSEADLGLIHVEAFSLIVVVI